MKKLFTTILVLVFFLLESCGPVVFTSRLGVPPPVWFYPNRVETVRYVYFPDYEIYYDLSSRNYIYFDNGARINVETLPKRFNGINLKRSKRVRINNYFGDNLKKYHSDNVIKRRSSSSSKRYQ